MKLIKNMAAIAAAAFLVTGCASVETEDWKSCAITGAAIGGVVGVFEDGDKDARDGALGALGGAIIGGTICALMADEKVTAPVPEKDSDGDGVVDSLDQCPNTPAGAKVDSKGCPLDSDGDGVPDYKDECPNSAPGAKVNELGCAKPLVLKGVNFHFDSAVLTEEAKAILIPVADNHKKYHADVNLLIGGHTDSQGPAEYNLGLSQRRASAVRTFMIAQGCDASKLTAVGYGEEKAIADNATKAGRAQNRRVELSVK
jgi:OOP family OmpA-OmpF porin|tara:strand:+ start:2810 stop:3580 length:771 start_codon:yes stop_codon:yes gene_type:complete